MDIILKEDITGLGHQGDIVTVKPGYGRNFLIPQGMATLATPSAKKMHEENVRQRAHKEAKVLDEASALAAKLEKSSIKIGAKAGENGKIFGSVNTIQISEELTKQGYEIDRKDITIKEDLIKEVGKYTATVRLHREVMVEIPFEIISE